MDEFWIVIIKIRFPAHSSLQIQENRQKLNRCATLADIFHDLKTRGWWSSWTTSFLKQYGNKIKICLCDKNWPFLNVIQSKFKYILANAFKISSSLCAPNRPTAVYRVRFTYLVSLKITTVNMEFQAISMRQHYKVSIELPVATRHRRDMTEKLLKANNLILTRPLSSPHWQKTWTFLLSFCKEQLLSSHNVGYLSFSRLNKINDIMLVLMKFYYKYNKLKKFIIIINDD